MSLVEVRSLTKAFSAEVVALRDVTLDFEAGQVTVVLGPSGAGKSTLLRSINGLETPTSGEVWVDGVKVERRTLRQVRQRVGMVFQHFNLVPRLNVMTNVLVGSLGRRGLVTSALGLFPKAEVERAADALRRVGLAEKAWERADRLSGGQQQRVGIARTIVQNPRAVLADEPVASLDPTTTVEVMTLLTQVCRDQGQALILNLHQVELAMEFGDRIVGLQAGGVLFDEPPARVSSRALDELYGKATPLLV